MEQPTPIVYVVDDDISVRQALASLFSSVGWRSRTFGSAQAFLARPRDARPGCLVLDQRLPDLSGLELQGHLSTDRLVMPVIFITGYGDVPMTVRAMKAGAVEFLLKPLDNEKLLAAARHAIARSIDTFDREQEMRSLRERYDTLSRREREVMALVTSGLLNKQVAAELGISEITVKAHRGNTMRKMGAPSLAGLVIMADRLRDDSASSNPMPDGGAPAFEGRHLRVAL